MKSPGSWLQRYFDEAGLGYAERDPGSETVTKVMPDKLAVYHVGRSENGKIVIVVDEIALIRMCAVRNPEAPYRVNNPGAFADFVVEQLREPDGDETSTFQLLLDQICAKGYEKSFSDGEHEGPEAE